MKGGLWLLEEWLGYTEWPGDSFIKNGTANTAMAHHGAKTFALMEMTLPFGVKINNEVGQLDISPVGYDDLDGVLEDPMSAHPKVDREKQEMMHLSYEPLSDIVKLYTFDKKW